MFVFLMHLWKIFWERLSWRYPIKLDSFFANEKMDFILILKIKNKRMIEKMKLFELTGNKEYMKRLHPLDAFFVGILIHCQNQKIFGKDFPLRIQKIFSYSYRMEIEPLIAIKEIKQEDGGDDKIKVFFKRNKIEKCLSLKEMMEKPAIISALDPLDAVSVGYRAGEFLF